MSYLPVFLGLATALCWGSADYLSRRQSLRVGYYKTVLYSQVTTLVFLTAITTGFSVQVSFPSTAVVFLAAVGLLNFFAFVYLYRAFARGVVSVVAPIAYTYPAVTAILSVILLGVSPTPIQWLGISAVIVGVILLSSRLSELRRAKGVGTRATAGICAAIAAAVLFGVVYVGVGYATPMVGFAVPPLVLRSSAALLGAAAAPILKESIRPSREALSNTIIIMGVLESIGFLAFNYGVFAVSDSLPIIASLSGMGGAVAASYGLFFLKERLEANQIVGLLLSLGGVFTLLYFGG